MKRTLFLAILLVCPAIFTCSFALASPVLLDSNPPDSKTVYSSALYFRYIDSMWLGQEQRSVDVPRTESPEKALVQALLDGPSAQSPYFRPLFPPGTQVLSVLEDAGFLFVTFNERLMDSLPGEEDTAGTGSGEGLLRRRLAMASLVNTLTESGQYRSVQVLILGKTGTTSSMRLSGQYYLDKNDTLLDPLTRQEEWIITPGKAAGIILDAWKNRAFNKLEALILRESKAAGSDGPALDMNIIPPLNTYEVSAGSIGPDGSYAVAALTAQVTTPDGQLRDITGFPLMLIRRDGLWKLSETSILLLSEVVR